MLLSVAVFIASLSVLLVAARYFTAAAERLGLAFGMSPFVVGVFIVAIGTSLPELVASLLSVKAGASEIVGGNVLGANAANLLLLLGVVSLVTPGRIALGQQYLFIDLHFLLGGTLLVAATMLDGVVSRVEGGFLIAAYLVYVGYLVSEGRNAVDNAAHEIVLPDRSRRLGVDFAIIVASGAAIYAGGDRTVLALQDIATGLRIPPAVAAVTILSLGTTLPELAVSITAARRGQGALAVGNIMGSCIFNALAVVGASGLAGGVAVPASLLTFALPFVAASTLLFYLLTQDKLISRWEGMLFLVLFGVFIAKISGVA